MSTTNLLLQPVKIGKKTVPNRIAMNAMECADADESGNPTERTYARYEKLFEGEAGFIDLEAIVCSRDNLSSAHQLSVTRGNAKALEKFTRRLKEINSDNVFVFQLTHNGEYSNPGVSKPVRVSDTPLYGFEYAHMIGDDEIGRIVDEFVESAKVAHDAGADGLDIKFCTGYLGSQILRPFNSRKWKYGGAWENRRQFAFDIVEKIVKAVNDPDFIIGSKVSLFEGFPGGQGTAGCDSSIMDLSESIDLIKGLEERGASYIIQSGGAPRATVALAKPEKNAPYMAYLQHYFSKVCRDSLRPETVVIGSGYSIFRDGHNNPNFKSVDPEKNSLAYWGNKNIAEGVTDMVALGRQSLADPLLAKKFKEGNEKNVDWCTACDKCSFLLVNQANVGCVVYNPPYAGICREVMARGK